MIKKLVKGKLNCDEQLMVGNLDKKTTNFVVRFANITYHTTFVIPHIRLAVTDVLA